MSTKSTYEVHVAVDVAAFGTVNIRAESQAEAERIAENQISIYGWASPIWQRTEFRPHWQEAQELRVLSGVYS